MADNIKVKQSSGSSDPVIATDEVGGRHYQIVKLAVGADGAAVPVDANGMPVTMPAGGPYSRLRATDGALFPEDLPATYSYNADGTLAHIEKTDGTSTWRYTYTWVNGKLTAESGWVKQ